MSLRRSLERYASDEPIVGTSRDELLDTAAEQFRGRRICLHLDDVSTALRGMVAFDGEAELMLLVPTSVDPEAVVLLATQAEVDAIWSSRPDDVGPLTSLPVVTKLETLLRPTVAPGSYSDEGVDTRWAFVTSGTTGEPKTVAHTFASLTRTTKTDNVHGRSARWGLLYEYSRFAGLQVLLQSLLGGSVLLAPTLALPFVRQLEYLVEQRCTHLSATPTKWRSILMAPESRNLDLIQITLGGEIVDDPLLLALRTRYPRARISHVYASTEAGVAFSVSDGRAGFPAAYLQESPAGIELRISGGHLQVRNERVLPRYLSSGTSFVDAGGFVETGDQVDVRGDRIYFLGRASGIINVGGNKVHPERVESVLLAHPQVAAARVYARSNPFSGSLVVADVQMAARADDEPQVIELLRDWCVDRLEPFSVPATIRIVSELAASPSGKVGRTA